MAIKLLQVSKNDNGLYDVTVLDTETVLGKNELGGDEYKTYTTEYDPDKGKDALKSQFETLLDADPGPDLSETITADIKSTIEAITPSEERG